MKLCAIPTTYADIRFRSRLEARWAAFFDLIGWRWTYEPVDLSGYIPDFVLHGDAPCLVEIKPTLIDDDWDTVTESAVAAKARDLSVPLVLLGSRPLAMRSGVYEAIGSMLPPNAQQWESAFLFSFGSARIPSLGNTWSSVHRACPDRLPGGFAPHPIKRDVIDHLWAKASNATQWKGTP